MIRRDGELREATWDEAFEEIDRRLSPILEAHGRNAAAVYIGNPTAHNLSFLAYNPVLLRALGSQNVYTASTVDQMPKQVAAGLMFGHLLSVPVPDLDRCDHLLMLGANPLVSNGSLLTAPNMRGRLRGIRERGGKVVVVDPRRTRTADEADEHHFIRPGSDALLLAAMACTLVEESLVDVGSAGGALRGPRRALRAGARLHARGGGAGHGHRRRGHPAHGARAGGRRARRRVRPHRHHHPGVRHAWRAGWWTCSTCSPATSTARAGRCSRWPPPDSATRTATPGQGRGVRLGGGTAGSAGSPESFGELPVAAWPRRSTRPARTRSGR